MTLFRSGTYGERQIALFPFQNLNSHLLFIFYSEIVFEIYNYYI